jgi:hypothetical protein
MPKYRGGRPAPSIYAYPLPWQLAYERTSQCPENACQNHDITRPRDTYAH